MRTNISRYVFTIFTALVLFMALVATSFAARTSPVVQIPFDFHAAGKTLPAGQYTIERSTQASAEGLILRSASGKGSVFVLTSAVQSNERQSHSRLVFTRYQGQYFLSQFWTSGQVSGRELIRTAREREAQRELARGGNVPETVTIALAR